MKTNNVKLCSLALVSCLFLMLNSCDTETINENQLLQKPASKVNVCHFDESSNTWKVIRISANALSAHLAHGDVRLDDQDGDGFVPDNACGFGNMGDCDDLNPAINPNAEEVCDGIDNNCDGQIDEDACGNIYEGNLTLTTQAEVDAFNYTQVTNWLTIRGTSITNIDGLSSLTSVSGIIILDTSITNIDGLASLNSISYLQIANSPVTNIDGLSGLDTVQLNLTNTALTSIEGLRFWSSVNFLEIYNAPIANIDALSAFTNISTLDLRNLPNLTDVSTAFNNLEIVQIFRIINCHGLTDIGGFDSLTNVGYLSIEYNPNLGDISGFNQLTTVFDFSLQSYTAATITGFNSLNTISYLNISETSLTAIPPFFSSNNSLNRVTIRGNSVLTDITAFQNINTVSNGIEITNNPNLEVCCAALPMLENSSSTINVTNNATGCNAVVEITSTCP